MSRITEIKRIQKHHTEEEMRKALQSFIDGKARLRVPVDDDDPDIVLGDAITELVDARQTIHGHSAASAITAFMGWLTSRDEVAGPFSARHEAVQAVQLIKQFCEAQGWAIDDTQYSEQIRVLKQKYPAQERS